MHPEILALEESILNNTFKVEKGLWGGAGQQVRLISGREPEPDVIEHKDAYG